MLTFHLASIFIRVVVFVRLPTLCCCQFKALVQARPRESHHPHILFESCSFPKAIPHLVRPPNFIPIRPYEGRTSPTPHREGLTDCGYKFTTAETLKLSTFLLFLLCYFPELFFLRGFFFFPILASRVEREFIASYFISLFLTHSPGWARAMLVRFGHRDREGICFCQWKPIRRDSPSPWWASRK